MVLLSKYLYLSLFISVKTQYPNMYLPCIYTYSLYIIKLLLYFICLSVVAIQKSYNIIIILRCEMTGKLVYFDVIS